MPISFTSFLRREVRALYSVAVLNCNGEVKHRLEEDASIYQILSV